MAQKIIINSLEEMQQYFDAERKAYFFIKDHERETIESLDFLDIEITFDLVIKCNLIAGNVKARNITAGDIDVRNITAGNISARDIHAGDISARDIRARDIKSAYLFADGFASYHCGYVTARKISSFNIEAWDINADCIDFYAVCFAYKNIVCRTISGGIAEKSRCFCIHGDVIIDGKKQ